MKPKSLVTVAALVAGGVLAFSVLATGQPWWSSATANQAKILSIDTIPLEGLSLDEGEFLILADTTPALIESAHVAVSVPCEPGGETSMAVVAGVAPDLQQVNLQYVDELSDPDNDRCTFHATVPEAQEDITDVAIINNGTGTVEFESGHFTSISLTTAGEAAAEDAEDLGEAEGGDEQNQTSVESTFTANLTGDNEVLPVDTQASGSAELRVAEGEDAISYSLEVQNIENVTAAHIHMGQEGEDGDIVVTLFNDTLEGSVSGLLASGTITSEQLQGPLEGQEISDLVNLIEDGNAYVNVHTEENPDGEIRGQLS